jgi:uncharacterized protein DUF4229
VKSLPPWVTYTVLRLLLIAVPLVILLLLQVPWWLSATIAAVVGLCLSYLLLGSSRAKVSSEIYAARNRKAAVPADDEAEDSVVDAAQADAAQGAAPTVRPSESERESEEESVRQSRDSR